MKRLAFLILLSLQAVCFSQKPKFVHYFAPPASTSLAAENDYLWIGTSLSLIRFNINTSEKTFFNPFNSGLPSCSIISIAVDKDGVKWIGTDKGLTRFDGITWTVYNKSNSGLPDNYVCSITIDSSGNKWIGTLSMGLVKFDGQNWTVYTPPNCKSKDSDIIVTAVDRIGALWIGTIYNGIFKFDGKNWTNYSSQNTSYIVSSATKIVTDNENNIWTATHEIGCIVPSFSKFDGNKWISLNSITNADRPHDHIRYLCANSNGYVCAATFDQIFEYEKGSWKLLSKKQLQLQSAAIDHNGNKWFTTYDGKLLKFNGIDWTSYELSNCELSQNGINSLTFDRDGKVWIACGSFNILAINGLSGVPRLTSFNGKSWKVYDTTACQAFKNQVVSTAVDKNGVIWLGTYGSGLVSYDGKKWNVYNHSNSGLPSDVITTIAIDSTGNIWIGSTNGIAMFDGRAWKAYKNSSLFMPDCNIYNMAVGKDGIIWMGIQGKGLASFNGRDWSFHTILDLNLPVVYVGSIAIDEQNRKWVTAYPGVLICIDGSNSKVYYPPALKSIRAKDKPEYPSLNSVAIDNQGNKWLCSPGKFFKFDGKNWTEYEFEDYGLPNVNPRTIAVDSQDNKWIGAYYETGLLIFNEKGINKSEK